MFTAMPGRNLSSVIGTIYEAGSDDGLWDSVGEQFRRILAGNTVSLWVGNPGRGRVDMLCTTAVPDPTWAQRVYAERYFALDTWTTAVARQLAADPRPRVWFGPELVPQDDFRRSEFYQDFARRLGVFELLAGCAPVAEGDTVFLGLHRPEGAAPFVEKDRKTLGLLLPHLQRALVLRARLSRPAAAPLSAAALEMTGGAVVILDAEGRILFSTSAAEALLAAADAVRALPTGPAPGAARVFAATDKAGDAELRGAVRRTALGRGAGASLALPGTTAGQAVAALVSRVPSALAPRGPSGCPVLVMLRPLARRTAPDPRRLAGMLGLTPVEAEVAAALSGGRSAEAVAADRGVSVATVRTHIRRLIEKLGVANLREFEALLASLPDLPRPEHP